MAPVVYSLLTPREVSLERFESRHDTGPNDIVVPIDRADGAASADELSDVAASGR